MTDRSRGSSNGRLTDRMSIRPPRRQQFALALSAIGTLVLFMASVIGCSQNSAPPPEGRTAIENVAEWFNMYRRDFRKPPPDEDAFFTYVSKRLEKRGVNMTREEFLTSPRDGQKFIISYGELRSKNPEQNLVVQEQEGYGGKKLVGFESGRSREVDDAELQSLLADKG